MNRFPGQSEILEILLPDVVLLAKDADAFSESTLKVAEMQGRAWSAPGWTLYTYSGRCNFAAPLTSGVARAMNPSFFAFAILASSMAMATETCRISGKPTVAALDVKLARLPADFVPVVSNALRNSLVESNCFKVQDEAQMREVLALQALNATDACDKSCEVQAGRFLQVRYLVTAQVLADSGGAVVLARLTDVESGTAVMSAQLTLAANTAAVLVAAMSDVAIKLATTSAPPLPVAQTLDEGDNGTTSQLKLQYDGSVTTFSSFNGTGGAAQGATVVTPNTWYHFALIRAGNNYTQYINGIANGTFVRQVDVGECFSRVALGAQSNDGSNPFSGYIDEFRLSRGIARWTANFTPPTAPYPR